MGGQFFFHRKLCRTENCEYPFGKIIKFCCTLWLKAKHGWKGLNLSLSPKHSMLGPWHPLAQHFHFKEEKTEAQRGWMIHFKQSSIKNIRKLNLQLHHVVSLHCSTISDPLLRAGVPDLQNLMADDPRWSWCNSYRNKLHNKCNSLESSKNQPSHKSEEKLVFHKTCCQFQKCWALPA